MLKEILNIPVSQLEPNQGQLIGVPTNPRTITKDKFNLLVKSLRNDPEILHLRELLVFPYNRDGSSPVYIVLGGNMRLEAAKVLNMVSLPCKVLSPDSPVEKLKALVQKDNISFGQFDFDLLANEWDELELNEWGIEFPSNWDEPIDSGQHNNKGLNSGHEIKIVFESLKDFDKVKELIQDVISPFDGVSIN